METWFKNSSIICVNGFNVYRKDRLDGRRGGGVALYIDRDIESYELKEHFIGSRSLDKYGWSS
jgi:hypothetical protein